MISGNHTCVYMPTGKGKSLCFQIPALSLPGIAIIVSPLIALIQDQIDVLKSKKLPADALHSGLLPREKEAIYCRIKQGQTKMLYLSPERLTIDAFVTFLASQPISFIAIDEAHCISEWGHNFRPAYLNIHTFHQKVSTQQNRSIPLLTLTASATPTVRTDIKKQLLIQGAQEVFHGFDRKNIFYQVTKKNNIAEKLETLLLQLEIHRGESCIIYVNAKSKITQIIDYLTRHGYAPLPYHASLQFPQRKHHQQLFMRGVCKIMVATNAFGMGIDKKNIRLIVHLDIPHSLEAYYQESGRAGRDDLAAKSIIIYANADYHLQAFFYKINHPSTAILRLLFDYLVRKSKDNCFQLAENKILQFALIKDELGLDSTGYILPGIGILENHQLLKKENKVIRLLQKNFQVDQAILSRFYDHEKTKQEEVWHYLWSKTCRGRYLLGYFGEHDNLNCGHCDIASCSPPHQDITILCQKILSAIHRTSPSDSEELISILTGKLKKHQDSALFGIMRCYSISALHSIIKWMNKNAFICTSPQLDEIQIKPLGTEILQGKKMAFYEKKITICPAIYKKTQASYAY